MENKITSIEELVLVMLLVIMIGVAIVLLFFVFEINKLSKRILAERYGKEFNTGNSGFKSWWKKQMGTTVAVKDEATVMLDHDYDGIRELDNHLPPWWLNMFYASIIFAVGYILVYHVFNKAPLQEEEYAIAMQEAQAAKAANKASGGNTIDESNVALMLDDKAALENGKLIFDANCMACHGLGGEGTVGPNLTDDYWLHGGSINDIFKTIKFGVPEKGMISWQATIKPKDMQDVSNYIVSLHGTNPPNAKAPEGDKYEAAAAEVSAAEAPADSAAVAATE